MVSTLVINVRCTCEEEYILLQKIHRLYQEDAMKKRLAQKSVLTKKGIEDAIEGTDA